MGKRKDDASGGGGQGRAHTATRKEKKRVCSVFRSKQAAGVVFKRERQEIKRVALLVFYCSCLLFVKTLIIPFSSLLSLRALCLL